ncbi:MAG: hypothetical protein M0C28_02890 [Candidatus Moduliflexus flocculans]|nr:hypothetical protein [Candidatus Moduliflexus flocculans]
MNIWEETKEYLDHLERYKAANQMRIDFYKHLTTLCLGAILFIAAFLEKVMKSPSANMGSPFSFFFLVSLFISVFIMTYIGDLVTNVMHMQYAAVSADRATDKRHRDQNSGTPK